MSAGTGIGGRAGAAARPSFLSVIQAADTLQSAGWTVSPPAAERIRLVRLGTLQELLDVGPDKAREIARSLPGTVMLPGGDLRVRLADVATFLDSHPLTK